MKPASIELGPYQLLERIGEGGSGQVFRARGPTGLVAVKVLGPASDMDDAARARFGREIAALGQIQHPHLVAMLDHGVDAELGPYLVLPLLPGTNLRALCAGRALCPEAALLLVEPIAQATAALHAAGYVHRDLKPENAIAGPDGAVTVIDLGLAWREGATRHTDTGAVVGSVGYMSPEQIEGRPVGDRADVWALGVMIYEWIAGARPFARGRPAEEAAAVLLGACRRLTAADRRCTDELASLVARCLAADPAQRPSAEELAAQLGAQIDWTDDRVADRAAVIADPVGYQQRVAPFRTRRLARLAREALDAGSPFAALAHCDRGLAYTPDDAELLALVAAAEAPRADAPRADASRPRARRRWLLAAIGALVLVSLVVVAVWPSSPSPSETTDPWAPKESSSSSSDSPPTGMADRDRKMIGDFLSVFEKALDQRGEAPRPGGPAPTTATGWLALAGTQTPQEAVASIRHALALQPGWPKAQVALCIALAAAHDGDTITACDAAIRAAPDDVTARAVRGAAYLDADRAADALADLDRVVAADPDPKWKRLRARAREATGDHAGAARDLANACELGDTKACAVSRGTRP